MIAKLMPLRESEVKPNDDDLFGFELEFAGINFSTAADVLSRVSCIDSLTGRFIYYHGADGYFNVNDTYWPGNGEEVYLSNPDLEMFVDAAPSLEEATWDFARYNWQLTTDPTAGCELRCGPFRWQDMERVAANLTAVVTALEEAGAEATANCGTHVHVNVMDMTPRATKRFAAVSLISEALIGLAVEPQRYQQGTYNRPQQIEAAGLSAFDNAGCCSTPHASTINLGSVDQNGSIEFRMLEGTLEVETILNFVEMLLRMKRYSMEGDLGYRIRQQDIMHPIRPSAKNVRHFLKALEMWKTGLGRWYLGRAKNFWDFYTEPDIHGMRLSVVDELRLVPENQVQDIRAIIEDWAEEVENVRSNHKTTCVNELLTHVSGTVARLELASLLAGERSAEQALDAAITYKTEHLTRFCENYNLHVRQLPRREIVEWVWLGREEHRDTVMQAFAEMSAQLRNVMVDGIRRDSNVFHGIRRLEEEVCVDF